jgi:hypothetical protein
MGLWASVILLGDHGGLVALVLGVKGGSFLLFPSSGFAGKSLLGQPGSMFSFPGVGNKEDRGVQWNFTPLARGGEGRQASHAKVARKYGSVGGVWDKGMEKFFWKAYDTLYVLSCSQRSF